MVPQKAEQTMGQRERSTILLITDDFDVLFQLERAAHRAGLEHDLHLAQDGQQAIAYFRRALEDRRRVPVLTLLDLRAAGIYGFAVLEWMRRSPRLRTAPVVILSADREELQQAFLLGADGWIERPCTFRDHLDTVELVAERWLSAAA